ncbi:unnamed protein product [Clonostachys chloroleuca]|uniref:Uncharacterized protein n=1 Tax=Clonostachys chloroleuca TaxID=1926264 RepID=A0AA35VIQ1_9HYPO|nr:unnamed protein product [Clonostachys chloroleuca]
MAAPTALPSLSSSGTFHRLASDEEPDAKATMENFHAESWKDWPNEAGFEGLEEHRGPIDLKIVGQIPSWAAGSLYRTGPGQNAVDTDNGSTHRVSHWFDGFAHMHKFDIIPSSVPGDENATIVRYSSRLQAETFVDDIKRRGWRSGISFGQRADPCVGIFSKFMSLFHPIQANNAVVIERNLPGPWSETSRAAQAGHRTGTGDLFVLTDNSLLHKVDPDTLEPLEFIPTSKLHPSLRGPLACAHPQRDPESGDMFNYNLEFGSRPTYRIYRTNASTGNVDILATLTAADLSPAYIHSMFLTKNYVVLCVPSSHFSFSGIKIPFVRNLVDGMAPFDKFKLTQWVVVDRRHGNGVVARFTTPAGFFFHSINAFEEAVVEDQGSQAEWVDLTFDYIGYESTAIIQGFYLDVILDREEAARKYWIDGPEGSDLVPNLRRQRFRIPASPSSSGSSAQALSPLPSAEEVFSIPAPHVGELPTINPLHATKPYRFVYSVSSRGLSTMMDCLVKTDVSSRAATIWAPPQSHTPGEAIFVPRPNATDEDDGVLLSVVLDGTAQVSYLVCLNAKTMEEVGRAELEFPIGLGFHGIHAPVSG